MSPSHHQQHQLHRIETGPLRSDPQLTAMPGVFGRLSAGQAMPAWEQVPTRQQSIRQAASLTVKATIVVAEALVLLLRAVLALLIVSFTLIPRDQPVRLAPAQPIREFARTPGARPATLLALPPQQAALEETFMEVTRGAADDRTPAATGGLTAAALVLRRREG